MNPPSHTIPDDELRMDNPPRGVRVEQSYDGFTTITVRMFSPLQALMAAGFTVLWNGFLLRPVGGIVKAIITKAGFNAPDCIPKSDIADGFSMFGNGGWPPLLGMALFFIPFVCAGIWIASESVYCFFGKLVIRVGNGEGTVFTGVGAIGRTRRFALRSVKFIGGHYTTDDDHGKSFYLHVDMNNGRTIKTPFLSTERVTWLAFALNKSLNR